MSALSRTHYAGRTQNAGRGLVRTLWNAPRAKRFYKEVTIKEVAAAGGGVGYGVHLDGRLLRTPAKNELSLKSRSLALAVAKEWDSQTKFILPYMMPLMTLTTTVKDQLQTAQTIRPQLEEGMLQYFQSDTVCFRSPDSEDFRLKRAEAKHWDPILSWFNSRFGTNVQPTDGLGLPRSDDDIDAVENYLDEQSDEAIAALDSLTISCKSFMLASAVLEGALSAEEACLAARVSEDAQIEDWGLAEGSHDIDIEELRMRVASASVYHKLSKDHSLLLL